MQMIVYLSYATRAFTDAELVELLKTARKNNQRNGITGLLLYKDQHFIQAVEGTKEAVQSTYRHIARDPRHKNLMILVSRPISERQFPGWAMGFHKEGDLPPEAQQAFSHFFTDPSSTAAALKNCPSTIYKLLDMFKNHAI